MIKKYLLIISMVSSFLVGNSIAIAEEAVIPTHSDFEDVIIHPNAFSESVLHTTRQRQEKIGFFEWENKGGLEYNYRTITFNNTYSLTGTSLSYSSTETIGIAMYRRYEITTYNYTYN